MFFTLLTGIPISNEISIVIRRVKIRYMYWTISPIEDIFFPSPMLLEYRKSELLSEVPTSAK
jgi:hypothetical protein